MDTTLREYLKQADDIHNFVEKFYIAIPVYQLENKINQIHISIKNIQAVSKRLADTANIITRLTHMKKKEIKTIDPYPYENDHAVLRTLYSDDKKEIVDNVKIPIKKVEFIKDLPIHNLYYVDSLKQYAININGIVIKGNLGNIVNYRDKYSSRCEYGVHCKSFKNKKECNYYHDPEDYLYHKQPVPEIVRNYTAGSWIYCNKKNINTYYTRHIGSKDKILYDLALLKKTQYIEEVSIREGQLIHDLLIYLILNQEGLLEKYKQWNSEIII
jgi:hypothetical protein